MNRLRRILNFYVEGFRGMTIGKTLWVVIIIKLVVMFAIIRLLLMPDQLAGYDSDSQRAEAVRISLVDR